MRLPPGALTPTKAMLFAPPLPWKTILPVIALAVPIITCEPEVSTVKLALPADPSTLKAVVELVEFWKVAWPVWFKVSTVASALRLDPVPAAALAVWKDILPLHQYRYLYPQL